LIGNKIDDAEMLQEEYMLLQPWLAEWEKKGKSMVFNLRGMTSAKLSGSSVGIPGSISGNFPHTMTQKLKLRRYGTS
jgi:hypothetical protein